MSSITEKARERFWLSMTERYGKRWTDQYGTTPTKAWTDLIDKHTLTDIQLALEALGKASPEFPPTQPQFETLLRQVVARRARGEERNFRRDFWRSLIVHHARTALRMTYQDFEQHLIENSQTLGGSLRMLLDRYDDMERANNGERTFSMELACSQLAAEAARAASNKPLLLTAGGRT